MFCVKGPVKVKFELVAPVTTLTIEVKLSVELSQRYVIVAEVNDVVAAITFVIFAGVVFGQMVCVPLMVPASTLLM